MRRPTAVIALPLLGALALSACTADDPPAPPAAEPASPTTSTPASPSTESSSPSAAPLDATMLGERCDELAATLDYGLQDSDPSAATAAERPDGLIFVTLPTQAPVISSEATHLPADLFCYLNPDDLTLYTSALGYRAVGTTVNLATEYDLLFTAEEPIDSLLD